MSTYTVYYRIVRATAQSYTHVMRSRRAKTNGSHTSVITQQSYTKHSKPARNSPKTQQNATSSCQNRHNISTHGKKLQSEEKVTQKRAKNRKAKERKIIPTASLS